MKTQVLRIRQLVPVMVGAWIALVGLWTVPGAHAAESELQNLIRPEFERPQALSGWGLVTGLEGTGDTGRNFEAALQYATLLKNAGAADESTLPDAVLKEGNIALVQVSASVPIATGGGQTYPCDVVVGGGGATSLRGGRLQITPLRLAVTDLITDGWKTEQIVAFAQGNLTSGAFPTRATIEVRSGRAQGAQLLDMSDSPLLRAQRASRTVVFDIVNEAHRSSANTNRLVAAINDIMLEDGYVDLARVAAVGQIEIALPPNRDDAFDFAGWIGMLTVDFRQLEPPATIRWSPTTDTLVITGNCLLLDAGVSIGDFAINRIEPARQPTVENPRIVTESTLVMSTSKSPSLALQDFTSQLNQLQMPAVKQAAVLEQLVKTGAINAVFVNTDEGA